VKINVIREIMPEYPSPFQQSNLIYQWFPSKACWVEENFGGIIEQQGFFGRAKSQTDKKWQDHHKCSPDSLQKWIN